MSTMVEVASEYTEEEEFPYGWRHVQQVLPDGTETTILVPLTLEDVLHPEEGDQVTHNTAHQRRLHYLCAVFRAQLDEAMGNVVLDDVRIAWDVPGLRPHGPDIMVILGVRALQNWSTFDVASEGVRPALIVELTSPETRKLDLRRKVVHYAQASVPLYIIVDSVQRGGRERLKLLVYQLEAGSYVLMQPDARGWFWLDPVGVWLAIQDADIICYDKAGEAIGDYVALAGALHETKARVEVEAHAAVAAQARADQAEARADQAEARADAEARARAALETRLQAIEAELRRLQGTRE